MISKESQNMVNELKTELEDDLQQNKYSYLFDDIKQTYTKSLLSLVSNLIYAYCTFFTAGLIVFVMPLTVADIELLKTATPMELVEFKNNFLSASAYFWLVVSMIYFFMKVTGLQLLINSRQDENSRKVKRTAELTELIEEVVRRQMKSNEKEA
ncbi:hypothetical protein [Vibrio splendidus]|uniref:hypothetical protein n=1 Tax=Vibrio splendidus TaxID=29497 RepID=UPI003D0E0AC2